jgi:hypothetical protein
VLLHKSVSDDASGNATLKPKPGKALHHLP